MTALLLVLAAVVLTHGSYHLMLRTEKREQNRLRAELLERTDMLIVTLQLNADIIAGNTELLVRGRNRPPTKPEDMH